MSIAADFSKIRTMEEVAQALAIIMTNLNNINKEHFNIYLSSTPQDVEVEQYDETGTLVTMTIPNLAKLKIAVLSCIGTPEGQVTAVIGNICIDTASGYLYYKASGSDAFGWVLLYGANNSNFLTPTGNGSQLTSLNGSAIASGTVGVQFGGTGVNSISGIIKGDGINPFTTASDGIDFLGPNSFTGVICFYPIATIPTGWLKCDGAAYSRTTYANLFDKIGTTYGAGDGSTTFNVPDLRDYYIRCWDGSRTFNTVQNDQVGGHTHTYSGTTGAGSAHAHSRGSMNITGTVGYTGNMKYGDTWINGAFYSAGTYTGEAPDDYRMTIPIIGFSADRTWTGVTSYESAHTHGYSGTTSNNNQNAETRVKNKALVPVIKY